MLFVFRADDYKTKQLTLNSVLRIIQQQWILLEDMFLLLENLLTDPVILKMYMVRVGLVKSFYC